MQKQPILPSAKSNITHGAIIGLSTPEEAFDKYELRFWVVMRLKAFSSFSFLNARSHLVFPSDSSKPF
jgi:hypothetical protein